MTTRPEIAQSSIPADLRELPRWLNWRIESREGKPTKVPFNPRTGKRAKSTNSATWATFEKAIAALENGRFDGIGFALGDGFTGIDLDGVRNPETGSIEQWAREIIDALDGYTEVSPSGTGVHIIVRGSLPAGRRQVNGGEHTGFGLYDSGRYFTMTGVMIHGNGVVPDRQAELEQVHQDLFPTRASESSQPQIIPIEAGDTELIERAQRANDAGKFSRLWSGVWRGEYGSQSEADLALCMKLAFWTGRNPARIDSVFRRSGLMRDKWLRHDYRNRTIQTALDKTTEVWTPTPNPGQPKAIRSTAPQSLKDVIATFQKWLYLPDTGALLVTLGAVAANRLDGDPVWVLLVGPPGAGKTEILASISGLPDVHQAATLTEPALLSGSPKREQTSASTGGLLRAIGQSGLLVCKDFGSVLNMRRETRSGLLAALREIYDGSWTRQVGTEGGRSLSWTGKIGLLGGCTTAIDLHHAVMSSLGERFLLYRFLKVNAHHQANAALESVGREAIMRRELIATVTGFVNTVYKKPEGLSADDRRWLVTLSTLVSRCRSAIERDGYSREIELIPDPEMPGRLVRALAQLFNGLLAIGVRLPECRGLIRKTALDCIPATRRRILEQFAIDPVKVNTTDAAKRLGYPSATTRRALEDLAAHGVLLRSSRGTGKSDFWSLTDWTAKTWREIG